MGREISFCSRRKVTDRRLARTLARGSKPEPMEIVEYDYNQVIVVVYPEDVLIDGANPGSLSGARLLDTRQVINDPKSILTPLWYALGNPRHERNVKQVPSLGVA